MHELYRVSFSHPGIGNFPKLKLRGFSHLTERNQLFNCKKFHLSTIQVQNSKVHLLTFERQVLESFCLLLEVFVPLREAILEDVLSHLRW